MFFHREDPADNLVGLSYCNGSFFVWDVYVYGLPFQEVGGQP